MECKRFFSLSFMVYGFIQIEILFLMPMVQQFEDLEIWQLARKLYNKTSALSERIP